MSQQAKIFISSPAEKALNSLRKALHDVAQELGHLPIMWEEKQKFGASPHGVTSVEHCLLKVRESDLFFLFLETKAGTLLSEAYRTVTHLEYIEAIKHRKLVYVFIEEETQMAYFNGAKTIIFDYIQQYEEQHVRAPSKEEILEFLMAHSKSENATDLFKVADPYLWLFLYEIFEENKPYVQAFSSGVGPDWRRLLSDLLRQGAELVPDRKKFKEDTATAASLSMFYRTFHKLMPQLIIQGIKNYNQFLSALRNSLSGGKIIKDYYYTNHELGTFLPCSAICIYQRKGHFLFPVPGAQNGDFSPELTFYPLDDEDSFVSTTYNANLDGYLIFYIPDKNLFYLTTKMNEYVVSYHFPAGDGWDTDKFTRFSGEVIDAIMGAQANTQMLEFSKYVLGGMKE
jgi:hypothetical protein